jgi:hypothetical protein
MSSRKLLPALAALLMLAAAVAAGQTRYEVDCSKVGEYEVDTTDYVHVNFHFSAISPVLPGLPVASRGNLIYSPAFTATWDRQLEFTVRLDHYAPRQKWRIGRYVCTLYVNGTASGSGVYELVERTPERMTTTITFVVPPTAATYYDFKMVEVSKPLRGAYCASLPDPYSWPSCPIFWPLPNVVTTSYPEWEARMVNGRRPGEVVEAYGVEAVMPDPWEYGIESDVGTFSYVQIDGRVYSPKVRGAPVDSSVSLHMVGMPKRWGSVKVIGARVPLYVAKIIEAPSRPIAYCRPPSCIVLAEHRLEYGGWCDTPTYVANVAVQSGVTMTEEAWLDLGVYSGSEIRLPLGSIMEATARVEWRVHGIPVYWGTAYARVINSPTYYEDLGRKKKLLTRPGYRALGVAFAVDQFQPSIEIGVYSRPIPYYPGTMYITAQGYLITSRCVFRIGPIQYEEIMPRFLYTPLWLTLGLYKYYSDLTGGRYPDLLHFLHGEPTTYYQGSVVTETGMVTVRTNRHYDGTTADPGGSHPLYYVTGNLPTDATVLYIISARQSLGGGGGGDGGNGGGTDEVTPWLVFLVPTAACRSAFCTSLSPELLGPLPPFFGDRALPNAGYSIMLMYIGETGRHRVKVYVEDGYIISGPPINVTRARNYKLVEIDKEWRPFEAVIVGPGWWVPFRPLNTCRTMPLNVSSIYTTPDRAGVYKIIVEVNGRNSTYVNHVTDRVAYHITTRTPAPESLTTTPFNMTAYVTLDGVPYYHAVYSYGEGGRLSPPACHSTWYNNTFPASQLYVSGDFWGTLGLTMLPKPVQIQYIYSKPRLELVDPWRGLVKVRADGPVSGFAFYAQRGGTWVKIGETRGSCVLINASRLFPWDPILVLPLVEQELTAAPGSTVVIWRPATSLLFKTWADVVGYPKGARSELKIVGTC